MSMMLAPSKEVMAASGKEEGESEEPEASPDGDST
jgi:hypothetical protein